MKLKYWLSLLAAGTLAVVLAQVPATIINSGFIPGGASAQTSSGFVLVEEHTASSSAALNFTTCISSTYDTYQIEFVQLIPATNGANLTLQVSTDGGSTYDSGAHYDWLRNTADNSSAAQAGANGDSKILFAPVVDTTSNWNVSGFLKFYSPGGSAFKSFVGQTNSLAGGDFILNSLAGRYAQTTAFNAFRLIASSGNLASGDARCYGLAK